MAEQTETKVKKNDQDVPFKKMSRRKKVIFILKLSLCIMTFGFAFPNIMSD
jgi:hypothetical protein